jgi:hypothetical protein
MHKKYREGLSTEMKAKLKQHASDDVTLDQRDLYSFNPKESLVSKEFAAADPEFWSPKPAAPKAAGKKGAEKAEAKKP